jgi:hypothetical protein
MGIKRTEEEINKLINEKGSKFYDISYDEGAIVTALTWLMKIISKLNIRFLLKYYETFKTS